MTGRSTPSPDEEPAAAGGVFRRFAPSPGSAFASLLSGLDAVFAPTTRDAREELQRQRRVGDTDPADTDPPGPGATDPGARVAAPGRPGTRFSGSILIRRGDPR